MNRSNISTDNIRTIVRWIARISSIPIIIIFLLMFLGEGFDPSKVKPMEWVMLIFGPFGLILGMILGWWKEGLGGAIATLSFFIAMIVGGYSSSGAAYMAVCAAPGFLFLLSWVLSNPAMLSKGKTASEENLPEAPPSQKS